MQFWAIISDSFREARDRKIFWVLLALSAIVTLMMLSMGFHADRVSLAFGAFNMPTSYYDPHTDAGRARIAAIVVHGLLDNLVGFVGVLLMIIATAGSLPTMMERGVIDVLLAKPISRSRLFLYKFLSMHVFAFVQGGAFVLMTFLAMGLRWGVWLPGYLLAAFLVVLLFSYVYCVSALVAVKTRSTLSAVLLSLAAWVIFAVVTNAPVVMEGLAPDSKSPMVQAMRVAAWIPPKTGDLPYIAARWAKAGTGLDMFPPSTFEGQDAEMRSQLDRSREIEQREIAKNPAWSIGTSLMFELAVVLLAMWSFARKDF